MTRSILIVGCGIAGPVLASLLFLSDGEKPHITIVERASSFRVRGQNVDIRGVGVNVIRKLGVESIIRSCTTGEEGALWVDSHDRAWGVAAADKTGKVQTATSDIEILRGKLAEIFYTRSKSISERSKKAGGHGINYIFGDQPTGIEQDGQCVIVQFVKGDPQRFDLVVGADGLQSTVRKLVFGENGESQRVHKTGMYGVFFSMPREKTDSDWRRWYHAVGARGIMIRPSHDPEKVTVFAGIVNDEDKRLDKVAGYKNMEQQKQLMDEYFRGTGWGTERVLREMYETDDFYYDVVAQIKMDHWSKGRVVLLGDAGYCASPISGMGTTLALTGAYNLAGALSVNGDIDAALAQYEGDMRPVVEKAQKLVPGMPHILHPQTLLGWWVLHMTIAFFTYSGLVTVLSMLFSHPVKNIPIDKYHFEDVPDGWALEGLERSDADKGDADKE